jgi:hypothetical protein
LPIAEAAVAHGDWLMVIELHLAYSAEMHGSSFLTEVTGTDPAMAYRYGRLRALGEHAAPAPTRSIFDSRLDAAKRELSPQAIAAANAWADETYRRFFADVPMPADIDLDICTQQSTPE